MNIERMVCTLGEVKFAGDEVSSRKFSGYGAFYGNKDSYGDVIAPGACAQYIADVKSGRQQWPAMLSQHGGWGISAQDLTPVGLWLDLGEDGKGLKVEGDMAETPRADELRTLMKMKPRPAISGLSIGYIPREIEERRKPDDPRRTLKRIDLVEISLVTFPANSKARIKDVKSIVEAFTSPADAEAFMREVCGLSRNDATFVVSRIKAMGQGEPAPEPETKGQSESDLSVVMAALKGRRVPTISEFTNV